MLMAILEFRAKVCHIYQKLQFFIDIIFKFLVSYLVIFTLNQVIGYDARLAATPVAIALSILCAFTPAGVLAFVCMCLTVAHVFYVNGVLAVFVGLMLIILYAFFLRFTPKHAYIMIAVPILSIFNIPYTVPLLAGLTTAPVTVFPVWCGIFFHYLISIVRSCISIQVDLKNLNTDNLLELVNSIVDRLLANKEMLYFMGVYTVVELSVFVVRKLKFAFSFEISIAVGTAVSILGHLIIDGKYPLSKGTGSMILFSIISGLLVMLIYSFIRILDYTSVENVQFEDDDYYYYVRAVPKIKTGLPKLEIHRMDSQTYFESSLENDTVYNDDPYTDPETGEVLMPDKFLKRRKQSEGNKTNASKGFSLPFFKKKGENSEAGEEGKKLVKVVEEDAEAKPAAAEKKKFDIKAFFNRKNIPEITGDAAKGSEAAEDDDNLGEASSEEIKAMKMRKKQEKSSTQKQYVESEDVKDFDIIEEYDKK